MSQSTFDEFDRATEHHKLPERIHHQKPKKPQTPKVKIIK